MVISRIDHQYNNFFVPQAGKSKNECYLWACVKAIFAAIASLFCYCKSAKSSSSDTSSSSNSRHYTIDYKPEPSQPLKKDHDKKPKPSIPRKFPERKPPVLKEKPLFLGNITAKTIQKNKAIALKPLGGPLKSNNKFITQFLISDKPNNICKRDISLYQDLFSHLTLKEKKAKIDAFTKKGGNLYQGIFQAVISSNCPLPVFQLLLEALQTKGKKDFNQCYPLAASSPINIALNTLELLIKEKALSEEQKNLLSIIEILASQNARITLTTNAIRIFTECLDMLEEANYKCLALIFINQIRDSLKVSTEKELPIETLSAVLEIIEKLKQNKKHEKLTNIFALIFCKHINNKQIGNLFKLTHEKLLMMSSGERMHYFDTLSFLFPYLIHDNQNLWKDPIIEFFCKGQSINQIASFLIKLADGKIFFTKEAKAIYEPIQLNLRAKNKSLLR